MQYFGSGFSLTLGAWRLRVSIDIEDAPDEPSAPPQRIAAGESRRGSATLR